MLRAEPNNTPWNFAMRIVKADVLPLKIPFTDGGSGKGLMPSRWDALDVVLLRLETEDGVVGWGDAFCYFHRATAATALREMVLPQVVGKDVEDIPAFTRAVQRRLHLFGRYGVTMFAISALDIALWDLAAKRAGVPLAELIGGIQRSAFPVYASLVRYGDPDLVERFARQAAGEGYAAIKLHEITLETIEAGRRGAGSLRLASDINCNWSLEAARAILPQMKALDLHWIEEPVFPCDDESVLGALEQEFGIAIASGENACTAIEFARTAPAIRFLQPSVTKVGGVTEFLDVCRVVEAAGKTVMPHCPYFGPGYWATAQIMAAKPETGMFEFLYIEPAAWLDPSIPLPQDGLVALPDKPGLGFDPDLEVLERFKVDA